MDQLKKVKSFSHLRELIQEEGREFVILYNGILTSSKYISFDGERFYIEHYIDGSTQSLTPKHFETSHIGEAITNGNLYLER